MQRSPIDAATADGVEQERCVVSSFKTTTAQKDALEQLVAAHGRENLPLEWVVDIADEQAGWFIGTAYYWKDHTQELYVMVPDQFNPTFEGWVSLDHRTIRLVECVDESSIALFNKLLRDSIVKVRWEVEWHEETGVVAPGPKSWVPTTARYYIRLNNEVLLEDHATHEKGLVLLPADYNLRLIRCVGDRGIEDFSRLLADQVVLNGTISYEQPQSRDQQQPSDERTTHQPVPSAEEANAYDAAQSIATNCRAISAMVQEHEEERMAFSRLFVKYIMEGSLDDGTKLLQQAEAIVAQNTAGKPASKSKLVALAEETESLALSLTGERPSEHNS